MIFETYNSEAVARVFFKGYFFGSIFLGLIALYGCVSGAGMLSALSGFLYIMIVSLLSRNKRFRRSNFSVLLCFFTLLYLNIPTAFILFEGSDYVFGEGLASIPFAQSDYQQSLPMFFLYLSVLWAALWLGIISVGTKIQKINQKRFVSIELMHILLLGIIVLIITWIDNQSFADVRLNGTEKINSLLAFVFFDHAYLVMAGLILFFKLNESRHIVNSRKITTLVFIIFIAFTFIQFIAGSKAAILAIFMLLMFIPFSVFREYPHAQVSFPSIKFLLVLMLLSLPLFYFALIQRTSLFSGIAPNLSTLLAGFSGFDTSVIYDITKQIIYRLSWGGLDRFLLIFQSFSINAFDPDTAIKFVNYLSKNTLNLLLPGTPFPESYAPSSQWFRQVILKHLVGGEIDANTFIMSSNTQPYTIFGVFVIIFGFAAPIFLYLFTFVYIVIFNKIQNTFLEITMLYFFSGALSSYGIEVVLGNSVHLFVSILLMYFLIQICSQFRIFVALAIKVAPSVAGPHHQPDQPSLGVEHRCGPGNFNKPITGESATF